MNDQSVSKTFKIRKTLKTFKQQDAQQQEQVANLKDLRLAEVDRPDMSSAQQNTWEQSPQIKPKVYQNDEDDYNCYRFPHRSFCGCQSNSLIQSFQAFDVSPGLFYGNFASGLKVRSLLELGITHILNVTCKQYTKRTKYFEYLDVDIKNNTEQDAKKFFRLTNRFIKDTLKKGGKVFIHSSDLQIGAVMGMGYLIGVLRIPMKQGLQLVLKKQVEISPHFMKQIESYDLQKMAFVSLQRQ